MALDIHVLELLASRVCHDLVSPVGAIHNGLELIEEMEEEPASGFLGESIKLIEHSAGQAERRLKLFRLAYGMAGRDQRGFSEVRAAAGGWVEGSRTRLDWPPGAVPDALSGHAGIGKVLLNVIVLAEEALTHGGTITVAGEGSEEAGRITVTADGRPGALNPQAARALADPGAAADLTPRSVHAYMTGRFAETYGVRLSATPAGPDRLVFRLEW
ncbi:histidine phosphotransferase family protein [Azospirillum halopraeferens]|uniref:histidine phosphotransferase family protein n=1 Tax=Azospirillum halopraeferens TaxID=34010 RepID=UPI000418C6E8|nr:histidine phosphotransferase family protein [Azospirillum halopraeferens]